MTVTAIRAVTDIEIQAAVQKLPPNVKRLAAAADIALTSKLTVAQVDAALAKAPRLSVTDRLSLKVGLERAGLLD